MHKSSIFPLMQSCFFHYLYCYENAVKARRESWISTARKPLRMTLKWNVWSGSLLANVLKGTPIVFLCHISVHWWRAASTPSYAPPPLHPARCVLQCELLMSIEPFAKWFLYIMLLIFPVTVWSLKIMEVIWLMFDITTRYCGNTTVDTVTQYNFTPVLRDLPCLPVFIR